MRRLSHTPQTRGFTMVEILTVIGIIALLAGLIAVGFNVLNSSQERRTRVALEAALGMMTEYENATPLTGGLKTGAVDASQTGEPDPVFRSSVAIMNKLLKVPANRSSMEKVDASNVASVTVSIPNASPFYTGLTPPTTETVLLDGWQKPLLYVGSGGLTNLKSDAVTGTRTVTAPNGRPFWVSAGADGNFETHDDNVYSFEN